MMEIIKIKDNSNNNVNRGDHSSNEVILTVIVTKSSV